VVPDVAAAGHLHVGLQRSTVSEVDEEVLPAGLHGDDLSSAVGSWAREPHQIEVG